MQSRAEFVHLHVHSEYSLLDGAAQLEKLVKKAKDLHFPAIALTAFARDEDRSKALEAGYQAHLAKPVDARQLVTVAAGLVQDPRRLTGRT